MATPATVNPFNFYPGRDGLPLQNGYLYFGEPFQDPELQPLQAYWDDANTQPAARPIRTINGYPARNGAPAQVFVGAQYSMRVRDSQGREVFYAPNVTAVDLGGGGLDIITASGGQTVVNLTNAVYTPGSNAIDVSLNGLILISGQDYFETGTDRITMASALSAGDQIRAFARSTFGLTQAVLSDWQAEVFNGDGTASQNFTLTRNPGAVANLDVSVTTAGVGSTLRPLIDYTLSGQVVTITPAPPAASNNVLIRYGRSLPQDALRGELASTASASNGTGLIGWLRNAIGAVATTLYKWLGWQPLSPFEFMTAAQVDDVQAGTLLLDVTVPLQAWANAIVGKVGVLPPGSYKMTGPISFKTDTTVLGSGIGVSRLCTALDVEQINADAAGAFNVTLRDVGFYNTYPVSDVAGPTPTGTVTSGSDQITSVSSTAGLYKQMRITGAGIPANTYIRKFTTSPNVIYLGTVHGVPVNATATTVGTALTTYFRAGQTKFHLHAKNAAHWLLDNCGFFTNIKDSDFSPANNAGAWFDRDPGASFFMNTIDNCWFHHAQILMGTSDSNIKDSHIWGMSFEYAVKLSAPGIGVMGNNISAGQTYGGVWAAASGTEAFGASNHHIVGNNIDGGDQYFSGYGIYLNQPLSVAVCSNRINRCYKGGIFADTSVGLTITGNKFMDNNKDGLGYSDIEISSTAFQTTAAVVSGNTFVQNSAASPTTGHAIREINNGFTTVACSYTGNAIGGSANYQSPAFSLASVPASGTYPRISGNAGGSMETETIANSTTNQYTGTLTGCTTSPTANIRWSRSGNLITLYIPSLTATSNTTDCTITGMPAGIRPATAQLHTVLLINNSVGAIGTVNVQPGGTLVFATMTPGTFTAANTKGCLGSAITYQLFG